MPRQVRIFVLVVVACALMSNMVELFLTSFYHFQAKECAGHDGSWGPCLKHSQAILPQLDAKLMRLDPRRAKASTWTNGRQRNALKRSDHNVQEYVLGIWGDWKFEMPANTSQQVSNFLPSVCIDPTIQAIMLLQHLSA